MPEREGAAGDSCWNATFAPQDTYAPLGDRADPADVAVVGAGIVGLTAALELQRQGRAVAVVEASRIARQVTGRSTAKVTSLHGLSYTRLEQRHGAAAAAAYARSNEAALAWIAEQVRERGIDCGFERTFATTYTSSDEQAVADEAAAAQRAGLRAELVHELELPFATQAAVRLEEQAQFHPTKYLAALARELVELGGRIYESSRVVDVDHGDPCTVTTEQGSLRARDVIVATHIPILDRGGFFGRVFPYRHMGIAGVVDADRACRGMHISIDEPTRSLRSAPWSEGRRLMVFIGEAFPTGHADAVAKTRELEQFAREHYGVTEPEHRWGNQDYYSADGLPFVGPILPGLGRIRVATGFSAWGITTGTAAALVLADDVLERRNEWASLYDSRRLGLRGAGMLTRKNVGVARSWLREYVEGAPERSAESVAPGEGALVGVDGKTAAAYRDESGALHAFDARCTHMGCHVRWNAAERSWDCHCHGSRFGSDGRVLGGPAVSPLRPLTSERRPS